MSDNSADVESFELFDKWKPMEEDYASVRFNHYNAGPGAQLPVHLLPSAHHSLPSLHRISRSQASSEPSLKLYICGIPADLTETGLYRYLESIGCQPISVKIINLISRNRRPIGFADFGTIKETSKALELIQGNNLYKLRASFACTESEGELKKKIIDAEIQNFKEKQSELMKTKEQPLQKLMANSNDTSSPLSSISENSGGDSCLEIISSLASTNKLVKVLQTVDHECSYCSDTSTVDHLHYIVNEQQVVDPSVKLPQLVDIIPPTCATCNANSANLKHCSQCRNAYYCDAKCQRIDWAKHKFVCQITNGTDLENDVTDASTLMSFEKQSKVTPKSSTNNRVNQKESSPLTVDVFEKQKKTSNKIQSNHEISPLLMVSQSVSKGKTSTPLNNKCYKRDINCEILGNELVSICFGRDPFDFYLHKHKNADKIQDLANKLKEFEAEFSEITDEVLPKGILCGGLYDEDNAWYRARITGKINDDVYALFFIDYGNTEPVNRSNIKAIPERFFDLPAQAIHCKLDGILPIADEWSETANSRFGEIGQNQIYTKCVVVNKQNDVYVVDLVDKGGESVTKLLVKENFAQKVNVCETTDDLIDIVEVNDSPNKSIQDEKKSSPAKQQSSGSVEPQKSPKVIFDKCSIINDKRLVPLQAQINQIKSSKRTITSLLNSLQTNSEVDFLITDVLNKEKGQYWAIIDPMTYSTVFQQIKTEYSTHLISGEAIEGGFVVVKASDSDFYRSYVIEVKNGKTKVLMIDAGYIENVSQVYAMDPKYYKLAAHSALIVAQNEDGIRKLNSIPTEGLINAIVLSQSDEKTVFKIDGILYDVMPYNLALNVINQKNETNEDLIDKLPKHIVELNKKMEALVLYQESGDPNVFYIAGEADNLTEIMSNCTKISQKFSASIKPNIGNVYLVKNTDDEWYRALVLNKEKDEYKAYFIDFGNCDLINSDYIMALPDGMSVESIPGVAVKCVVNGSSNSDAIHKKIEKAVEGTYLLKIEAIAKLNSCYSVNVF